MMDEVTVDRENMVYLLWRLNDDLYHFGFFNIFGVTPDGELGVYEPLTRGEVEALPDGELWRVTCFEGRRLVPVRAVTSKRGGVEWSHMLVAVLSLVCGSADVFSSRPGFPTWGPEDTVSRVEAEDYNRVLTLLFAGFTTDDKVWEKSFLPPLRGRVDREIIFQGAGVSVVSDRHQVSVFSAYRVPKVMAEMWRVWAYADNMDAAARLVLLAGLYTSRDNSGVLRWCVDDTVVDAVLGFFGEVMRVYEVPLGVVVLRGFVPMGGVLDSMASCELRVFRLGEFVLEVLAVMLRVGVADVNGFYGGMDFSLPTIVFLDAIGLSSVFSHEDLPKWFSSFNSDSQGVWVNLANVVGCDPLPVAWRQGWRPEGGFWERVRFATRVLLNRRAHMVH